MEKIRVLDSTLRDGAQGIGISFSVDDKLNVVAALDRLGVDYIEGGNPASNPKEQEFFKRVKGIKLKNSKLCAFGSTRRKNIKPEEDANLAALLETDTPVCTIFGKSWKFHVDKVLETTYEENLNMIYSSCLYLKSKGKELIYDAEHFFDGYLDDKEYALETLKSAVKAGADSICLCDTNGGIFPSRVTQIVEEVRRLFDVPIGLHFHDDCGVATANTISGVLCGATQIQGTLLGFGERCGNANLSTVIPNLELKLGYECLPKGNISLLMSTAKEIAGIANMDISNNMPYVGENAFAHKAGMHAAGVLKDPRSFEHISPETVGNQRRFPTSEISGKAVVFQKIKAIAPDVKLESHEVENILADIKRLEMMGYQFEGADASFELLVRKQLEPFKPYFKLIYYNINTKSSIESKDSASAVVKMQIGDNIQLMAGEGNGPVNALDKALRKALEIYYPVLSMIKLTDYKVRVLEKENATASAVRVLITSSDGINSYTTVGVSGDVVHASYKALEDSMEYLLLKGEHAGK